MMAEIAALPFPYAFDPAHTALVVIDMVKAVDKAAVITDVRVEDKTGGKSGDYHCAP